MPFLKVDSCSMWRVCLFNGPFRERGPRVTCVQLRAFLLFSHRLTGNAERAPERSGASHSAREWERAGVVTAAERGPSAEHRAVTLGTQDRARLRQQRGRCGSWSTGTALGSGSWCLNTAAWDPACATPRVCCGGNGRFQKQVNKEHVWGRNKKRGVWNKWSMSELLSVSLPDAQKCGFCEYFCVRGWGNWVR